VNVDNDNDKEKSSKRERRRNTFVDRQPHYVEFREVERGDSTRDFQMVFLNLE